MPTPGQLQTVPADTAAEIADALSPLQINQLGDLFDLLSSDRPALYVEERRGEGVPEFILLVPWFRGILCHRKAPQTKKAFQSPLLWKAFEIVGSRLLRAASDSLQ